MRISAIHKKIDEMSRHFEDNRPLSKRIAESKCNLAFTAFAGQWVAGLSDELYTELESVVYGKGSVPSPNLRIEFEHVISEMLRIYEPLWGLLHVSSEDVNLFINGYVEMLRDGAKKETA